MSWSFILLLVGACGLGLAHAFEPDHMAAVSTFVARRPKPREAALFGIRWAMGHGLSLFVLGSMLYLLKRAVDKQQPQLFASGALDRLVGVVLVVLGIWTLWQIFNSRASAHHEHGHFHDGHFHSHSGQEEAVAHGHSHDTNGIGPLGMGVLHGAAGTGAFIGQTAVALSSSYLIVFLYTLMFSVGVLIAMGAYASALGGVLTLFEKRSAAVLSGARFVTGALTCAIGFCLIAGVELPGLLDRFVH